MSRASRQVGLVAAAAALMLAACENPHEVKNGAPPIRTITEKQQPDWNKLPVVQSEPVAPDPQKALENYRKLLELNPDAATSAEALKRTADLQVQMEDSSGKAVNAETVQDSINIYNRLLVERPGDRDNDRILYQLSRAYQNIGNIEQAVAVLQRLEREYPTSPLMADARFRDGELLYARGRYHEAEQEYRVVLDLGPETRFYEPAQYKYGWALYEQQRYADDIPVFFAILDRELPVVVPEDPEAAIKAVAQSKQELVRDSVRVVNLSFTALGAGKALNDYFAAKGEPRFIVAIYNAVGSYLLSRHRYTDAANTYAAFVASHPSHPEAPLFQNKVIAAYQDGGFGDLVVQEKERYAKTYDPSAPYWAGRQPPPDVMTALRQDFEDLGLHYQAKAQSDKEDPASKQGDFLAAAGWYRKLLDVFPQDPKAAEINYHYADALYDGGQTRDAAEQYQRTAYGYPGFPKAPEAAYAAVQAWQRLSTEVPPDQKGAVLQESVTASVKLADTFPANAQSAPVLTRAAEDLYSLHDVDQAATLAQRVLSAPSAAPEQRTQALGVVADSRFAQAKYAEAEAAYTQLLASTPPNTPAYKTAMEQLAAAIYKQGAAARDAGDLRTAAGDFQRVGRLAPDASIRPNADYDAASAFVALGDWQAAEPALEDFRSRYPTNPLQADVDKKLALAYQKDNKPQLAAGAFLRIAQRPTESPDTRRDASWLAATMYDQMHDPQAAKAYEVYLQGNPQPLDRAMQTRRRLADMAKAAGDRRRYESWLRDIITADGTAGAQRTQATKTQAAHAALELAENAAADAREVSITLPINKTLPRRKAATEQAVQALESAAAYDIAETTTAATLEIGNVYRDFSRALVNSQRPATLKGEELDQYNELLEEQSEPIDEQAIKAYAANVDRAKQGLWNQDIRASADALAELAPGQYAKREQHEEIYEKLH